MAGDAAGRAAAGDHAPRANIALALAGVAVALYIVAMIVAQDEKNDWLWPLAGVVGAAAAITGWSAGRPRPRGRALVAVVIGGLLFAVILAWAIVAGISGDL